MKDKQPGAFLSMEEACSWILVRSFLRVIPICDGLSVDMLGIDYVMILNAVVWNGDTEIPGMGDGVR